MIKMLDGLLKPKFYTKWFGTNPEKNYYLFIFGIFILIFNFWVVFFQCSKTNIKLIKTRSETIKKKKKAVQKYLKNDIADLLRNGLDINAYNRVISFIF